LDDRGVKEGSGLGKSADKEERGERTGDFSEIHHELNNSAQNLQILRKRRELTGNSADFALLRNQQST
jgi:hypothetical protein